MPPVRHANVGALRAMVIAVGGAPAAAEIGGVRVRVVYRWVQQGWVANAAACKRLADASGLGFAVLSGADDERESA